MTNKTKRVIVAIDAEAATHHFRSVIMEVPEDMSTEEIEGIDVDVFNNVEERSEWIFVDPDTIRAAGFPDYMCLADEADEPDVIVSKGDDGKFIARGNKKFLLDPASE